jgi:DnaJ like chaperone protein
MFMQKIRESLHVKHLVLTVLICGLAAVLAIYHLSSVDSSASIAMREQNSSEAKIFKILQDDGTVVYLSGKQALSKEIQSAATEAELPEIRRMNLPISSSRGYLQSWWIYLLVPIAFLFVWYRFLGGRAVLSRILPGQKSKRTRVYLECVFGMLSKLSELDGLKCTAEKAAVDNFICERVQMGLETRELAKGIFESAESSQRSFDSYLKEFCRMFRDDYQLRYLLLQILSEVANADGDFSQQEEEVLRSIAKQLGLEAHFFTEKKGGTGARADHDKSERGYRYSREGKNARYYRVLGCPADASVQQVKKAYRKLVFECHPDRLIAKGMPQEFVEVARERFLKVQEAYEAVVKDSSERSTT